MRGHEQGRLPSSTDYGHDHEGARQYEQRFRAYLRALGTDELIALARSRGIDVPREHTLSRAQDPRPGKPIPTPRCGESRRWSQGFTIAFPRPANCLCGGRLETREGFLISFPGTPSPSSSLGSGEPQAQPRRNQAGAEEGWGPPPGPDGPPSGETV